MLYHKANWFIGGKPIFCTSREAFIFLKELQNTHCLVKRRKCKRLKQWEKIDKEYNLMYQMVTIMLYLTVSGFLKVKFFFVSRVLLIAIDWWVCFINALRRVKWERVNVSWVGNGDYLEYNLKKTYQFVPEMSAGSEDDVLTMMNVPLAVSKSILVFVNLQ